MATSRWQSLTVAAVLTLAFPAALAAQEAAGLTPDPAQAKKGQSLWNSRGCTGCHSIGHGKRSGPDLAGVLEVTRPLDRDIERTQSGLLGTFVLMGGVAVVLVGISLGLWLGSRARGSS